MRTFTSLAVLAALAGVNAGTVTVTVGAKSSGYTAGSVPVLNIPGGTTGPGISLNSLVISSGGTWNSATSQYTASGNGYTSYTTSQPLSYTSAGNTLTGGSSYVVRINYPITTVYFTFSTSPQTATLSYSYTGSGPAGANAYVCDPCNNNGNTVYNANGNTASGPNASQVSSNGFAGGACPSGGPTYTGTSTTGPFLDNANQLLKCANIVGRTYQLTGFDAGSTTGFSMLVSDVENAGTNSGNQYAFVIIRAPVQYIGDPQIVGIQGQDFQVHGMPDEIFNMISSTNVQVNARFTYLSEAECPDNYTSCFAHPGTYISEQGIRVGSDKVHVTAGPAKKGLTVKVNGHKVSEKKTMLKLGSVEIVNHRRVVIKTPIAALTMTNSDKFMNQEMSLYDEKLLAVGATRKILNRGEAFHPEVPLHGLQGQTWRNVEYPSGLEYEGSIMDYHVVDGNIFGTDFTFNQFKH